MYGRAVACLLLLAVRTAAAQQPPVPASSSQYSIEPTRISAAPAIDGRLDDAAWQGSASIGSFIQYEPKEGAPATDQTEVRIAYDDHTLYFGVRAWSAEPGKIVANVMRRDGDLSNDESVQIFLDTFRDRRNAFFFTVNPLGAQVDGLVRNEGEELSFEWNGLWDAATTRDGQGWTAEIAIPFKTLRFNSADEQVWGFNVRRFIAHRQEETHWRPILRQWGYFARFKVSEFGELHGLQGVSSGGRYQLLPYAVARNEQEDFGQADQSTGGDIGGDFKWNITTNLVADVTVNTDFAEAESDLQQVNLTRFKLFYPEKREFFLEGANLFYFGERIEPYDVPERFIFFFSRQIGISENGVEAIPVLGGAKVSGRVGKTGIGFLNLTTDEYRPAGLNEQVVVQPQTNFTVLRLKQEIYKKSSIGLIGISKDPSGEYYNRGYGFDWDLAFGKHLQSIGFATRTATPGLEGDDHAVSADILYQGHDIRARTMVLDIGENFNDELGFITRTGIRKSQTDVGWIFKPQKRLVHRGLLIGDFSHVTDQQGNLESQISKLELNLSARSRDGIAWLYFDNVENLTRPLVLAPGVVVPPGRYRFRNLFTGVASSYTRPLGFTAWYDKGGFYNGDRLRTLLSVVYRPVDGLLLSVTYDRQKIDLPTSGFVSDLAYSDFVYSFTPALFTRVRLQWNKEDNFRANVLLDWTYGPGSDIYLVYNDIQDLNDFRRNLEFNPLSPGRTLTLKAVRRFDF